MDPSEIIIIGSGLGGLCCGAILSMEGKKVTVIEKQPEPGGSLRSFFRRGVVFDTGVHYIGGMDENQPLNRYFSYLGIRDKLSLHRMDRDRFDVIAIGEKEYPLAQGFENFTRQLLPCFPDHEKSLREYTRTLEEIASSFPLYNLELPGDPGTEQRYRSQSAYRFYQELSHLPPPSSFPPVGSVLAGNNFLFAGDPERTPLHIPALINHSFISSAWRPAGGSDQLAEALASVIRKNGGEIFTGHRVCRIHRSGGGLVVSAKNGRSFFSPIVISGIHPYATLQLADREMIRPSFFQRIGRLDNTISSFALYLVLKENSFPRMDHNYYYHSTPDVWSKPAGSDWPANYLLYTPLQKDPGLFAPGVVILTTMHWSEVSAWENTETGHRGEDYNEFREERAERLLDLVEKRFPGLREKILYREISTPLTWKDHTGTPGGSMYGIRKDFRDPGMTTVLPATKIPGLYFTGQNINLHGVPGVTIGAVMTCGEILGLEYLIKKIRNA